MNVRKAMLSDPVTTTRDERFESLLERLLLSRQATAAVLDKERRLVGIVGIHDVLRKIVPLYVNMDQKLVEVMHDSYFEERLERLRNLKVESFMTWPVDTVAPDDSLIKAVGIIVERKRKTLPVIEGGKFVGMVTRRTILETVAPALLARSESAEEAS